MTERQVISFIETVGTIAFLLLFPTAVWAIWDMSKLTIQVLFTELAVFGLCYCVSKAHEEDEL